MCDSCKEKIRLAIETNYLYWSKRVISLIGDYSQNISLSHTGDEKSGDLCYFSPVNLIIFGLVDVSFSSKKLNSFVCAEIDGAKS